jgi:ABC-type Fe3+/spermidine/putrescine transport system ATPase subunit
MATSLQLEHLSKTFAGESAVSDVSLQVEAGQFCALLGASGSGKTTLLRMVAGLLMPDAGTVSFDGQPVTHLPPERRFIGMVFQHHRLFPHMTVAQNITFGLRMRGLGKHEQKKRMGEVLELIQLPGFEKRYPASLSGGQQQRIALARTIVTRPKVLLMDEPFANLDAQLRDDLREVVADLQRHLNMTTLFVTHDQAEALQLADVVAVMDKGSLLQVDTPKVLFERPKTRLVAEFMGARNFLSGELTCERGHTYLQTSLGHFQLMGSHQPRQATAIIRPEQVTLLTEEPADKTNMVAGEVVQVRYQGGSSLCRVQIHNDEQPLYVQTNQSATGRVWLQFPPEHLWVLEGA